uniref:PNPLA domain-containing protein n=1 Tax=Fusarium oxysporum (strain Fo5176) TaxID=660025 RepID=A0A0C4DI05_FUSOF
MARLRLDIDTGAENKEPVLIANTTMALRNCQRKFGCCSSQSEIPLSREMSDTQSHGLLFSHLLYPFVDIFCFYSYGPSDLTKIARWIATWPSQNGPLWKPSLMVLLREKHLLQPNAAAVAERLFTSTITALTSNPLDFYFTDSWFLPATDSSSSAPIEAGFHEHLAVVRQRRRESGLLLSVEHTNALFERAFESAGTLYHQPIDLIRSARRDIPVSTELADHLVQFMSHIPSPEDLISFASPIIASSLFCDHYLPDMHCQVQQQLDLPIPVQEFFTLAYGVSAASLPGVNWIRAILSDSLYSETDIEIALKSVFGEKAFTEVAYAQRIGAKIGIPAATIKQPSSLCLFTNYNSSRQGTRGYTVLAAAENIKTWEVYFRAKYLAGLGTFQDAGVLANNPLSIALAEFAATNGNAQPDLVLNVGTGTSPNAPLRDEESNFITDSWILRLKRAYMSLMQGRRIWDDVTSTDINAGRNCGSVSQAGHGLNDPQEQQPLVIKLGDLK